MHDPCAIAFEILYPWDYPRKWFNILLNRKHKYYENFITIWHVDPETDGTDDSCRWFWGKLNENDKKIIKNISDDCALRHLWNLIPRTHDIGPSDYEKKQLEKAGAKYREPTSLKLTPLPYPHFENAGYTHYFVYNVFNQILWNSQNRHYSLKRRDFNKKERVLLESLVYNMIDNLQFSVCNPDGDIESVVACCYRNWKRLHRPWYKHARWHIHHWRIQVHFLNKIRRKIFTKCEICNKRFPFGYCPVSNHWDSPKVKWYESEKGLSCGASKKEDCRRGIGGER